MRVVIRGLSTANPEPVLAQDALAAGASDCCCFDDRQRRVLPRLYDRTHVDTRACGVASTAAGLTDAQRIQAFFPPATGPDDAGPPTATRNRTANAIARGLAERTCTAALAGAGVAANDISHLVSVSCTSFAAPGVSLHLLRALGLPPGVSRTDVGFMGCHGAMNGLRAADALVRRQAAATGRPAHALLCATEVCSAHFQYGFNPTQIVANALFADGSAAAVVTALPGDSDTGPDSFELVAQASIVIPDTDDQMSWHIGDHGFEMYLSPQVPDLVGDAFPAFADAQLAAHGESRASIGGWVVHPGGPRIVESVLDCLDLDDAHGATSRAVLREHGNMSSPTVLFILDRMRRAGIAGPYAVVALGPGLTAELALLR